MSTKGFLSSTIAVHAFVEPIKLLLLEGQPFQGEAELRERHAARIAERCEVTVSAECSIDTTVTLLGTAVNQTVTVPASEVFSSQIQLPYTTTATNVILHQRANEPPTCAAQMAPRCHEPNNVIERFLRIPNAVLESKRPIFVPNG